MVKKIDKYSVGNHTHLGMVRKVNQDSFGSAKTAWGDLYVVADGMGGHKGGEIASKLTVSFLCDEFKKKRVEEPNKFLADKLVLADKVVIKKTEDEKKLEGMGTTVVAVIIKENKAYYAHVGDSRIYLFRNKKGMQLTKDHSYVQQLVDQGLIKPNEAENHPQKNKILQAIGIGNINPSLDTIDLYKNDVLLLCTDGLSGEVNKEEMWSTIESSNPMESCKNLINLANKRGGADNSTVIIIQINQGSKAPKVFPKDISEEKGMNKFALLTTVVTAILVIALIYLNKDRIIVSPDDPKIDPDSTIKVTAEQDSAVVSDADTNKVDTTSVSAPDTNQQNSQKNMSPLDTSEVLDDSSKVDTAITKPDTTITKPDTTKKKK